MLRSLRTLLRATDSRKESRCLSCYPIQLSKNRLPSKGRTCCQTPSSVSSGNFSLASRRENRFRLTRTLRLTLAAWDGKIGTAGTAGTKYFRSIPTRCQPRPANCLNLTTASRYSNRRFRRTSKNRLLQGLSTTPDNRSVFRACRCTSPCASGRYVCGFQGSGQAARTLVQNPRFHIRIPPLRFAQVVVHKRVEVSISKELLPASGTLTTVHR